MKKEGFLRALRIIICICVILGVFYLYIPPSESAIEGMNDTVGKEHVDILCIGSSHMCAGINPIKMYKDNGYATFILWRGSQSPWQNYYYLKEALACQTPTLVVLDVYMFGAADESSYEDYQTVMNLLDNPLSVNKIEAVMASTADSKLNVLLRFPYTHDDYTTVPGFTLKKFFGIEDYSMGGEYEKTAYPYMDATDVSGVNDIHKISSQNELYLRRIIEFCKDRNIDIALINAPSPKVTEEQQMKYNYIGQIANEYDISFIDGNRIKDVLKIDWTGDCKDESGHLNQSGILKLTSYFEKIVSENYNIPDRRGNIEYASYDEGVRLYGDLFE